MRLRAPHRKDVQDWAKDEFPEYLPEDPAVSYGRVVGAHPAGEWLDKLAAVIGGNAEVSSLESWECWKTR
ncbi:MAG: hypothetical protein FD129_2197 [bacterium]|nr:MAG: hypothetical protein FD129_2197 [bacterium]